MRTQSEWGSSKTFLGIFLIPSQERGVHFFSLAVKLLTCESGAAGGHSSRFAETAGVGKDEFQGNQESS